MKVINEYKCDVRKLLTLKYCICVLTVIILGYSFSIYNVTMDIDDICSDYYLGSGKVMLGAGRWGMVLWSKIFGYRNFFPCLDEMIAIILFIWSAINFCVFFRRETKDWFDSNAAIIFSCLYLSYSLINEIWNYYGGTINVCGGYLLVSFALLIMQRKKDIFASNFYIIILLTWVAATYESLLAVYVLCMFINFVLDSIYIKNINFQYIIKKVFDFVLVLLFSVIFRFIIGIFVKWIFKIPEAWGGSNTNILDKRIDGLLSCFIKSYT